MPKDDWVYVAHMLDMSKQALEIVSNKTRSEFDEDIVLRLALTHLVQVINPSCYLVVAG